MQNKFRAGLAICVSFIAAIGGISVYSYVRHESNLVDSTTAPATVEVSTEVPRSIDSKAFEEVEVKYEADLTKPGGPLVPYAVYDYRTNNVVESGTIIVKDFWYEGDGITVSLDVNGTAVEYTYIPETPED